MVLATKAVFRTGLGPNDAGASRQHILDAVDASLRRLETDYIDLYQLHGFDQETPLEETLQTLNDLVRAGKVRYIGCSNYAAWQIVKALGISERNRWARFVSHQPEYSPPIGRSSGRLCRQASPKGLVRSSTFPGRRPAERQVQAGRGAARGLRAVTQGPRFAESWLTDRNFTLAETMTAIAAEVGCSLSQLTLAWVMAKPGIASAIVGATRVEQLAENLKACDVKLTDEIIRRVDDASATFVG